VRIVIVTESFAPQLNGVAQIAVHTAEQLSLRGHRPVVVTPTVPGGGPERGDYPVVRVPSVPFPGYPDVRVALPGRRVAEVIAGHRPDVVHLASPFALGAQGMTAARRAGVPVVAVFQTDMAAYARTYLPAFRRSERVAWWLIRRVHTAAERTLAPSTAACRELVAHGIPRVHLWPHGVDSDRFAPWHRDGALRRELAPSGEVLVGYVGRLAPEKQVERLAGVCRLPGVRVIIVGDGPARPKLERELAGAVFLGRRTGHDLARVYASLDLFVHSGPFETFGLTVQEAMASGLPVVAPAAGGPLDLVRHGQSGYLVPPRDERALRERVYELVRSAELRATFGRAGRAAAVARTWDVVDDLLIEHYYQVIARSCESPARIT
jgi:phosphatidylinositol alpha 1,6-mannosyltransferase